MPWLDELSKMIVAWDKRFFVELVALAVLFLLIHFVGYPMMVGRVHTLSSTQSPATPITTGNITTTGPNSGVTIGGTPQPTSQSPSPNQGTHK